MKKRKVHKNFSVKIGDKNKFKGYTAIGENVKIIKEEYLIDNSTNYDGEKININNTEKLSIFLTNKFNEKKVNLWSILSGIGGLAGVLMFINSILPEGIFIFKYLPRFNFTIGLIGLIISLIFLIAGIWVFSALRYKYWSKCPKCKKYYAMEEDDTPKVREVEAHDGIKKTTTRFYKCRYCGYKNKDTYTKTIPYKYEVY